MHQTYNLLSRYSVGVVRHVMFSGPPPSWSSSFTPLSKLTWLAVKHDKNTENRRTSSVSADLVPVSTAGSSWLSQIHNSWYADDSWCLSEWSAQGGAALKAKRQRQAEACTRPPHTHTHTPTPTTPSHSSEGFISRWKVFFLSTPCQAIITVIEPFLTTKMWIKADNIIY